MVEWIHNRESMCAECERYVSKCETMPCGSKCLKYSREEEVLCGVKFCAVMIPKSSLEN